MKTDLKQDVKISTASVQLRILYRRGILSIMQRTFRFHTKQETSFTFIRWFFHVVQFGSMHWRFPVTAQRIFSNSFLIQNFPSQSNIFLRVNIYFSDTESYIWEFSSGMCNNTKGYFRLSVKETKRSKQRISFS
jgi:hypothetical protein